MRDVEEFGLWNGTLFEIGEVVHEEARSSRSCEITGWPVAAGRRLNRPVFAPMS